MVKVFDEGHIPTSDDHFYACHPVEFDGDEAEGQPWTAVVDTDTTLYVDVLGTAVVGDYLIATTCGGRWVAEKGGGSTAPVCFWFCGPKAVIGCTGGIFGGVKLLVTISGGSVTALTGGGDLSGCTANPNIVIDAPLSGGTTATATAKAGGVISLVLSASVTTLTITNGGTGYAMPPAVAISAPGASGGVNATATATLTGGIVTGLTITNPGSGYLTNPAVSIAPPGGGGVTATATAPISLGGSGYGVAPVVTIAAPGGSGTTATATAVLTGGVVTALNITSKGSLYTTANPVVTIAAPGGGGVTAQASATASPGRVTQITITNPGSGYVDTQPVPSKFTCTVTFGSITIGPLTLTYTGGGSPCTGNNFGGLCGCTWGATCSFTAVPACGPSFAVTGSVCLFCTNSFPGFNIALTWNNGSVGALGTGFACPGSDSGFNPTPCISGTGVLTNRFALAGIVACTSRPYSHVSTTNLSTAFLVSFPERYFLHLAGGGSCPGTSTLTFTFAEA